MGRQADVPTSSTRLSGGPQAAPHAGLEAEALGSSWENMRSNSFQGKSRIWMFLLVSSALNSGQIAVESACAHT